MSVFKVINDKAGNRADTLYQKLNYVKRYEAARYDYIYGAGVSRLNTYEEMMAVKATYNQQELKAYYHYVFNPEDNEKIDKAVLLSMGIKMANFIESFHGYYQVLMAVHFDHPEHLHMHFIVNNIDLMTGKRMNLGKKELYELKQELSHFAQNYGVSKIRQYRIDTK